MTLTVTPLRKAAKFIRGITFKPEDVCSPSVPGAVVCMRTKNVQADIDLSDLIAIPEAFVRRAEQNLVEGDLLVSSANSWNLVGKACWVPNLSYRSTAGGFGVIPEPPTCERGHHIPEPAELFCDIVFDDRDFDLKSLVEDALAKLQRNHSRSLPVHKYVNAYREKFGAEPPAELLADCKSSVEDLLSPYLKRQLATNPIKSIEELNQQAPTKEKWFELFPRLQNPGDYLPELAKVLEDYLTEHPDALRDGKSGDKTNLKRVIRIYDWLEYGKTKDAHDS